MSETEQVKVDSVNYTPTDEDRENDRRQEEWKERRREQSRQEWLRFNRRNGLNVLHIG